MRLLWGDIHNHCGITYGFGSLENALSAAREHLDFCAVTGHAMWPDMPEKNNETEFLIEFHKNGFQKLAAHWPEIKETIKSYNKEGEFATFYSYEMHTSGIGDYHLVSPDDDIELLYAKNPKELLKKLSAYRAIMIPHHIAYTPGYRGIDWNSFDSSISPVVEVCSKHGCSMNDKSLYPYYHNMGVRDTHNTVYEGLKQGHQFGFVGSTDHHAGYPGSYGDCKMAVLCEEKTRDSIYNAICARRTYAVTGDKIKCNFTVNGEPFGSIIAAGNQPRVINLNVEACHFIDKIVLFKNLKPIKIINGEMLDEVNPMGRYKVRIEMGWGNNTDLYTWNGSAEVENGDIVDVEKCFRGRSVLAPSKDMKADDSVNQITNKVLQKSLQKVEWICQTVKNVSTLHPSTSAIVLEIDGSVNTKLKGCINGKCFEFTIEQLLQQGYTCPMKPYNSQTFKVYHAVPETQYKLNINLIDKAKSSECDIYHAEIRQTNSSCAYITPIYVK